MRYSVEVRTLIRWIVCESKEVLTMPDDPTKKRPQDSSRINPKEKHELQYWAEKFGVSPDRIRQAVERVGNSVEAVEREIKRVA